jgi:hypothetical protein
MPVRENVTLGKLGRSYTRVTAPTGETPVFPIVPKGTQLARALFDMSPRFPMIAPQSRCCCASCISLSYKARVGG